MAKASLKTKGVIFDILNKALESTDLSQTDYVSFIEDKMCYNCEDYSNFRTTPPKIWCKNPKRSITILRRYQTWLIDVLPYQADEEVREVLGKMIGKAEKRINHTKKNLTKSLFI